MAIPNTTPTPNDMFQFNKDGKNFVVDNSDLR